MEEKKTVTLDLTGCQSLGEIHQRIKKTFDFPECYGENWSAFWDFLGTECDANEIIVVGMGTLPKEFQWHCDKLVEILQRLKESRAKYSFLVEIEIQS